MTEIEISVTTVQKLCRPFSGLDAILKTVTLLNSDSNLINTAGGGLPESYVVSTNQGSRNESGNRRWSRGQTT